MKKDFFKKIKIVLIEVRNLLHFLIVENLWKKIMLVNDPVTKAPFWDEEEWAITGLFFAMFCVIQVVSYNQSTAQWVASTLIDIFFSFMKYPKTTFFFFFLGVFAQVTRHLNWWTDENESYNLYNKIDISKNKFKNKKFNNAAIKYIEENQNFYANLNFEKMLTLRNDFRNSGWVVMIYNRKFYNGKLNFNLKNHSKDLILKNGVRSVLLHNIKDKYSVVLNYYFFIENVLAFRGVYQWASAIVTRFWNFWSWYVLVMFFILMTALIYFVDQLFGFKYAVIPQRFKSPYTGFIFYYVLFITILSVPAAFFANSYTNIRYDHREPYYDLDLYILAERIRLQDEFVEWVVEDKKSFYYVECLVPLSMTLYTIPFLKIGMHPSLKVLNFSFERFNATQVNNQQVKLLYSVKGALSHVIEFSNWPKNLTYFDFKENVIRPLLLLSRKDYFNFFFKLLYIHYKRSKWKKIRRKKNYRTLFRRSKGKGFFRLARSKFYRSYKKNPIVKNFLKFSSRKHRIRTKSAYYRKLFAKIKPFTYRRIIRSFNKNHSNFKKWYYTDHSRKKRRKWRRLKRFVKRAKRLLKKKRRWKRGGLRRKRARRRRIRRLLRKRVPKKKFKKRVSFRRSPWAAKWYNIWCSRGRLGRGFMSRRHNNFIFRLLSRKKHSFKFYEKYKLRSFLLSKLFLVNSDIRKNSYTTYISNTIPEEVIYKIKKSWLSWYREKFNTLSYRKWRRRGKWGRIRRKIKRWRKFKRRRRPFYKWLQYKISAFKSIVKLKKNTSVRRRGNILNVVEFYLKKFTKSLLNSTYRFLAYSYDYARKKRRAFHVYSNYKEKKNLHFLRTKFEIASEYYKNIYGKDDYFKSEYDPKLFYEQNKNKFSHIFQYVFDRDNYTKTFKKNEDLYNFISPEDRLFDSKKENSSALFTYLRRNVVEKWKKDDFLYDDKKFFSDIKFIVDNISELHEFTDSKSSVDLQSKLDYLFKDDISNNNSDHYPFFDKQVKKFKSLLRDMFNIGSSNGNIEEDSSAQPTTINKHLEHLSSERLKKIQESLQRSPINGLLDFIYTKYFFYDKKSFRWHPKYTHKLRRSIFYRDYARVVSNWENLDVQKMIKFYDFTKKIKSAVPSATPFSEVENLKDELVNELFRNNYVYSWLNKIGSPSYTTKNPASYLNLLQPVQDPLDYSFDREQEILRYFYERGVIKFPFNFNESLGSSVDYIGRDEAIAASGGYVGDIQPAGDMHPIFIPRENQEERFDFLFSPYYATQEHNPYNPIHRPYSEEMPLIAETPEEDDTDWVPYSRLKEKNLMWHLMRKAFYTEYPPSRFWIPDYMVVRYWVDLLPEHDFLADAIPDDQLDTFKFFVFDLFETRPGTMPRYLYDLANYARDDYEPASLFKKVTEQVYPEYEEYEVFDPHARPLYFPYAQHELDEIEEEDLVRDFWNPRWRSYKYPYQNAHLDTGYKAGYGAFTTFLREINDQYDYAEKYKIPQPKGIKENFNLAGFPWFWKGSKRIRSISDLNKLNLSIPESYYKYMRLFTKFPLVYTKSRNKFFSLKGIEFNKSPTLPQPYLKDDKEYFQGDVDGFDSNSGYWYRYMLNKKYLSKKRARRRKKFKANKLGFDYDYDDLLKKYLISSLVSKSRSPADIRKLFKDEFYKSVAGSLMNKKNNLNFFSIKKMFDFWKNNIVPSLPPEARPIHGLPRSFIIRKTEPFDIRYHSGRFQNIWNFDLDTENWRFNFAREMIDVFDAAADLKSLNRLQAYEINAMVFRPFAQAVLLCMDWLSPTWVPRSRLSIFPSTSTFEEYNEYLKQPNFSFWKPPLLIKPGLLREDREDSLEEDSDNDGTIYEPEINDYEDEENERRFSNMSDISILHEHILETYKDYLEKLNKRNYNMRKAAYFFDWFFAPALLGSPLNLSSTDLFPKKVDSRFLYKFNIFNTAEDESPDSSYNMRKAAYFFDWFFAPALLGSPLNLSSTDLFPKKVDSRFFDFNVLTEQEPVDSGYKTRLLAGLLDSFLSPIFFLAPININSFGVFPRKSYNKYAVKRLFKSSGSKKAALMPYYFSKHSNSAEKHVNYDYQKLFSFYRWRAGVSKKQKFDSKKVYLFKVKQKALWKQLANRVYTLAIRWTRQRDLRILKRKMKPFAKAKRKIYAAKRKAVDKVLWEMERQSLIRVVADRIALAKLLDHYTNYFWFMQREQQFPEILLNKSPFSFQKLEKEVYEKAFQKYLDVFYRNYPKSIFGAPKLSLFKSVDSLYNFAYLKFMQSKTLPEILLNKSPFSFQKLEKEVYEKAFQKYLGVFYRDYPKSIFKVSANLNLSEEAYSRYYNEINKDFLLFPKKTVPVSFFNSYFLNEASLNTVKDRIYNNFKYNNSTFSTLSPAYFSYKDKNLINAVLNSKLDLFYNDFYKYATLENSKKPKFFSYRENRVNEMMMDINLDSQYQDAYDTATYRISNHAPYAFSRNSTFTVNGMRDLIYENSMKDLNKDNRHGADIDTGYVRSLANVFIEKRFNKSLSKSKNSRILSTLRSNRRKSKLIFFRNDRIPLINEQAEDLLNRRLYFLRKLGKKKDLKSLNLINEYESLRSEIDHHWSNFEYPDNPLNPYYGSRKPSRQFIEVFKKKAKQNEIDGIIKDFIASDAFNQEVRKLQLAYLKRPPLRSNKFKKKSFDEESDDDALSNIGKGFPFPRALSPTPPLTPEAPLSPHPEDHPLDFDPLEQTTDDETASLRVLADAVRPLVKGKPLFEKLYYKALQDKDPILMELIPAEMGNYYFNQERMNARFDKTFAASLEREEARILDKRFRNEDRLEKEEAAKERREERAAMRALKAEKRNNERQIEIEKRNKRKEEYNKLLLEFNESHKILAEKSINKVLRNYEKVKRRNLIKLTKEAVKQMKEKFNSISKGTKNREIRFYNYAMRLNEKKKNPEEYYKNSKKLYEDYMKFEVLKQKTYKQLQEKMQEEQNAYNINYREKADYLRRRYSKEIEERRDFITHGVQVEELARRSEIGRKNDEIRLRNLKREEERRIRNEAIRAKNEAIRAKNEAIRLRKQREEERRIRNEAIRLRNLKREEERRIRNEEIRLRNLKREEERRIRNEEIRLQKLQREEEQRAKKEEPKLRKQREEERRIRNEEIRLQKLQREEEQRAKKEEPKLRKQREREQIKVKKEEPKLRKQREREQIKVKKEEPKLRKQREEERRIRNEEIRLQKLQREEEQRAKKEEPKLRKQREREQIKVKKEESRLQKLQREKERIKAKNEAIRLQKLQREEEQRAKKEEPKLQKLQKEEILKKNLEKMVADLSKSLPKNKKKEEERERIKERMRQRTERQKKQTQKAKVEHNISEREEIRKRDLLAERLRQEAIWEQDVELMLEKEALLGFKVRDEDGPDLERILKEEQERGSPTPARPFSRTSAQEQVFEESIAELEAEQSRSFSALDPDKVQIDINRGGYLAPEVERERLLTDEAYISEKYRELMDKVPDILYTGSIHANAYYKGIERLVGEIVSNTEPYANFEEEKSTKIIKSVLDVPVGPIGHLFPPPPILGMPLEPSVYTLISHPDALNIGYKELIIPSPGITSVERLRERLAAYVKKRYIGKTIQKRLENSKSFLDTIRKIRLEKEIQKRKLQEAENLNLKRKTWKAAWLTNSPYDARLTRVLGKLEIDIYENGMKAWKNWLKTGKQWTPFKKPVELDLNSILTKEEIDAIRRRSVVKSRQIIRRHTLDILKSYLKSIGSNNLGIDSADPADYNCKNLSNYDPVFETYKNKTSAERFNMYMKDHPDGFFDLLYLTYNYFIAPEIIGVIPDHTLKVRRGYGIGRLFWYLFLNTRKNWNKAVIKKKPVVTTVPTILRGFKKRAFKPKESFIYFNVPRKNFKIYKDSARKEYYLNYLTSKDMVKIIEIMNPIFNRTFWDRLAWNWDPSIENFAAALANLESPEDQLRQIQEKLRRFTGSSAPVVVESVKPIRPGLIPTSSLYEGLPIPQAVYIRIKELEELRKFGWIDEVQEDTLVREITGGMSVKDYEEALEAEIERREQEYIEEADRRAEENDANDGYDFSLLDEWLSRDKSKEPPDPNDDVD